MLISIIASFVVIGITVYFARKYKLKQSDSKLDSAKTTSQTDLKSDESKLNNQLTIVFATQSGTSENFGNEMLREAKLMGMDAKLCDIQNYSTSCLFDENYMVFLMSTFGEGEPTDSAIEFWKWINDNGNFQTNNSNESNSGNYRKSNFLSNLNFGVFALGNRQYINFCKIGKDLDERLTNLGGEKMIECGQGDDDGDLEKDFKCWKENFWKIYKTKIGHISAETSQSISDDSLKFDPQIEVRSVDDTEMKSISIKNGIQSLIDATNHSNISICKVLENRELLFDTSSGDSTRHIEIDLSESNLTYTTADNLGIHPRNDYKKTIKLCQRLNYDPRQVIKILNKKTSSKILGPSNTAQPASHKLTLPEYITIVDCLLWYIDFNYIPRRNHLPYFAQYAKTELDRSQLKQFAADEGYSAYLSNHYTLTDLLEKFPSISIPLADLIDLCPKLIPRFYTISSSSLSQPTKLSVTVKLQRYLNNDRVNFGTASSYLCAVKPQKEYVAIFIRPSAFRFPPTMIYTQLEQNENKVILNNSKQNATSKSNAAVTTVKHNSVDHERIQVSDSQIENSKTPQLPNPLKAIVSADENDHRQAQIHLTPSIDQLTSALIIDNVPKSIDVTSSELPPIIMIGPGTGIAPFRAFVQEAEYLVKMLKFQVNEMYLFYGCRNERIDFLYRDEIYRVHNQKILNHLITAFSRDKPKDLIENAENQNGSATAISINQKTYVQHRLAEIGQEIWTAIDSKNAYIFVCGGTLMGKAIRETLTNLCRTHKQTTQEQANQYIEQLIKKGHYVQELWS